MDTYCRCNKLIVNTDSEDGMPECIACIDRYVDAMTPKLRWLDRITLKVLARVARFDHVRTGGFDPYGGYRLTLSFGRKFRIVITDLICWSVSIGYRQWFDGSLVCAIGKLIYRAFETRAELERFAPPEDYPYYE